MHKHPGRLPEILDALALASSPDDRAQMLIDFADRFREVPPEVARRPFPPERQVPACESDAYAWGLMQPDGTLKLYFAVENPSGISGKALAAILDLGLSGFPPQEVARVSTDIVPEIFRANISMGKGLGLMSMVRAVAALGSAASDLRRGE
ncbi:MAG: SufE family protein [Vicinamibacterales bacterium]